MNRYLLDTSFIISYLAPDEKSQEVEEYFEEYYLGFSKFYILELTYYEVLNSLRTMVIQKRITVDQSVNLIKNFMTFDFPILKVKFREAFYISLENNLSYYDASYLEASKSNKIKLLSLDKKLSKLSFHQ